MNMEFAAELGSEITCRVPDHLQSARQTLRLSPTLLTTVGHAWRDTASSLFLSVQKPSTHLRVSYIRSWMPCVMASTWHLVSSNCVTNGGTQPRHNLFQDKSNEIREVGPSELRGALLW
jgi:hypothetical protein